MFLVASGAGRNGAGTSCLPATRRWHLKGAASSPCRRRSPHLRARTTDVPRRPPEVRAGAEAARRGAARGRGAWGTCHGARQARSQDCERDPAAGAHRAQCQARTGVVRREPGARQTKDEEEKEAASDRGPARCQGLPWRILRGLAPLSWFTVEQEGKMGQSRARRSNVSLGVKEGFLAEEAPPLAFRCKQTALSEMRSKETASLYTKRKPTWL